MWSSRWFSLPGLLLRGSKPMSKKENSSGQSLLEVVVALGVTTLVLTALVSVVTVAVRNARFAKNQSLATKYAQEGIEAARTIRDRDWSQLANGIHGLFWDGSQWSFSGSSDSPSSGFTRVVDVSEPLASQKLVTVTVSWSEGGRTHQSRLTTYLTEWE